MGKKDILAEIKQIDDSSLDWERDIIFNDSLTYDDKKECLGKYFAASEMLDIREDVFPNGSEYDEEMFDEIIKLEDNHLDDLVEALDSYAIFRDWEYNSTTRSYIDYTCVFDEVRQGKLNDKEWASDFLKAFKTNEMVEELVYDALRIANRESD